ncbi:MAG: aldose 1-epimerase [Ferruginibacter sp.]
MFSVSARQWKETEIIQLTDLSSKTHVEILPSCGALLHSFTVAHKGGLFNVIDQYEDPADFKKNVEAKGFKSCKLSPFVCRIKKGTYLFGDEKYIFKKFYLEGNALHGLIYDLPFTVKYTYADSEHAGVALEYQYRGEDPGYPFHYDCVVTYHLKKNNELVISTDIFNKGDYLMPLQDGWHPYFTLGNTIDELLLQFQSEEMVLFDEALIPTGKLEKYNEFESLSRIGNKEFDNCFTLKKTGKNPVNPVCVLRNEKEKIQVEIIPDKSYPYLQLYTPPHRQSIAIENLSGAPDAFNNGMGLVILPPDANRIFTVTYKVSIG